MRVNVALVLSVGAGGFLGAISRFLLAFGVQKLTGSAFPYGTLMVNVLGSFIIGFLFLYFEQSISPTQKVLLMTGFLGALTTFSTFSLETVLMLQDGFYSKVFINILLNVTLSIAATLLGMMAFRKVYGL